MSWNRAKNWMSGTPVCMTALLAEVKCQAKGRRCKQVIVQHIPVSATTSYFKKKTGGGGVEWRNGEERRMNEKKSTVLNLRSVVYGHLGLNKFLKYQGADKTV